MFRRSFCAVAVLCVLATGLVVALADDTPRADAHEVCVGSPFGPLCTPHTHPKPTPVPPTVPDPTKPCGGAQNCPGVVTPTPAPTPKPCTGLFCGMTQAQICAAAGLPVNSSGTGCGPKPTPNPPDPTKPCGGAQNCPTATPEPTPQPTTQPTDTSGDDDSDGGGNDGRGHDDDPGNPNSGDDDDSSDDDSSDDDSGDDDNNDDDDEECPAGQYSSPPGSPGVVVVDIYTGEYIPEDTPQYGTVITNRGIAGEWRKVSSNPDCYQAVRLEGGSTNLLSIVVDGVTYLYESGRVLIGGAVFIVNPTPQGFSLGLVISGQKDRVLSAKEKAVKEAIEALEATDRFLHRTLCNEVGGFVVGVTTGGAGIAATTPAGQAILTAAGVSTGTAAVVLGVASGGVAGYCFAKHLTSDSDSDSDDDSDSDSDSGTTTPTATPTATPTPTATRHPVCGVAPSNGVIQGYPSYNRLRCGPTQWKEAADSSECTAVGLWKIADGEMLYICARGWYARWMASNR